MPDANSYDITDRHLAAADLLRERRTEIIGLEELARIWREDPHYREAAVPMLTTFLLEKHPAEAMETARRLLDEFAEPAETSSQ